jgi:membrane-bound lytic murein transglycosylase B
VGCRGKAGGLALAARARNVVGMTDPVTLALAVATAVTVKVAETLTDKGQESLAEIVRKIRARLKSRPAEVAVLDAAVADDNVADPALANPAAANEATPPEATRALARVLDREFSADPAFRAQIEALLRRAEAPRAGGVTNVFTGKADKVVQIGGDVGDLTIN